jgi:hypothetical protein
VRGEKISCKGCVQRRRRRRRRRRSIRLDFTLHRKMCGA